MARNLEKQEKEQREAALAEMGEPSHVHHVHQFRHGPGTMVMWTVCVVFSLLGIFAILGALTTPATPGNSTGDGIAGAAIFLVIGAISGIWAWNRKPVTPGAHVRYASRPFTRTSVAVSHSAVLTGSSPADSPATTTITSPVGPADEWNIAPAPRYRGRHHAKDPRKQAAVIGVLFAISIVALVSGLGLSERSSYTQHHGVPVAAQVVSYSNHQSCGRSSCSESFAATVTLASQVKGRSSTVVHGNGYFPDAEGDDITVRVDPHDPSYGELPGNALDAGGSWIVFLVFAVILGLFFMGAVFRLIHFYAGILPGRHLPGR
jgi:hypothetical protein